MEFDKPKEACGVFGIYASAELPVGDITYLGLQAIQHRGQQGAGISISDGETIQVFTGVGLVKEVFKGGSHLNGLSSDAHIATGHNRYQTAGTTAEQQYSALQPMLEHGVEEFTIAHNGHVEGVEAVARELGINVDGASSDTEIMKMVISHKIQDNGDLVGALQEALPLFKGAFSLILSTTDMLIAARDPQGFRPLHLGKLDDGGWVVASEIAALNTVGAAPTREIRPGEIVTISSNKEEGLESYRYDDEKPATCAFEFVYFSRPSNEIQGEVVTVVRQRMGRLLARDDTVDADLVVGVPNSGLVAAKGYSLESGIPLEDALDKNNYIDRTFIKDTQKLRTAEVRKKFSPITQLIKGKSCVVVDDSIVRGTTTKELVNMFRDAGASEVHVRISSPPYKWPCFFGMDTSRIEELIASKMSTDEIRSYIGADSLKFLSNEDLQAAVGQAAGKVCTACTTGIYPIEVSNLPS